MGTVAFTTQPFLDTMILSLGIFCLVGVVLGAPLQDTPEVLEAKENFLAAFETAREGKHAALTPVNNDIQAPQIANAYIDDTEPVAEEKEKFKIAFDTAEAGGLKHMQAEPIANFYIAKVDEVVAAVKSVDAKPSPAAVVPAFYNFPAFTYPITPLKYFLLPVAAPVVQQAAAAPVAAEAPAVEEA